MQAGMDPILMLEPLILRGIVADGLGEAAHFMLMKWFRAQCRERLGFNPTPGTFNLRMQGEHWQRLRPRLRPDHDDTHPALAAIHLAPPDGFCAASCYPVRIADAIDAWAIVPHVDHYPHDKLEVIAPVKLRVALDVATGETVTIDFGAPAPLARHRRTEGEQA